MCVCRDVGGCNKGLSEQEEALHENTAKGQEKTGGLWQAEIEG